MAEEAKDTKAEEAKDKMAEEAKEQPKHQFKLSVKWDNGTWRVWVSDKVTKKRWQMEFTGQRFQERTIKEWFRAIHVAIDKKPPTWAVKLPLFEGDGLHLFINEGEKHEHFTLNLPETAFDENDL
eukprot:336372_1